ncbi:BZ3500_MvSof-1268-A1-R1_Chr3-1g06061 [Microbotryum saponariae]|uniref:BZ3500_MvSof-1268-A1-R1_Chr3-1g06061 protein n=1 Tax=Microbotryum saponariae TaxID=289078 RepID=A0A2X0MY56_9BASI|nr:BZ3500_MvSof-1268-A1-R1_Chr3-1g06061 [Microbotryum saponariae]SDA03886.1 BZ3501_MvSof-1269-A2-R1_Chr3-2g05746 [Microbotryum saponariae]
MPPISNPIIGDNGARVAKLATDFILARLAQHRSSWTAKNGPAQPTPPLFVGVQGPQGSGKSHLVSQLPTQLAPLRTASLSLDELYLPHAKLQSLAASHPKNKLIQGRGQPGTHDLALGVSVLSSLAGINEPSNESNVVELPTYDKSLHDGQGDRAKETIPVQGPIDIVLFEGWCVGFQPLDSSTLTQLYTTTSQDPKTYAAQHLDYETPFFIEHSLDHLLWVNERLANYAKDLWSFLDCFVQIEPRRMSYVWQWRLEQEHNMKSKNGGVGMTDEQVRQFIGRRVLTVPFSYMPSYELFQSGIQSKDARWFGKVLKLVAGREREVVAMEDQTQSDSATAAD